MEANQDCAQVDSANREGIASIKGSEGVAEESPGDTRMDAARRPARTGTRGKPALYASMGVTEYWLFNPVGALEGASKPEARPEEARSPNSDTSRSHG